MHTILNVLYKLNFTKRPSGKNVVVKMLIFCGMSFNIFQKG